MSVLTTDLYTLTMADTFVRHHRDDLVSFEVTIRRLPPGRPWVMVAGVREVVDGLLGLSSTPEELDWLRADGRFSDALVDALGDLRFTGTVWAVPEGTCLPAGVPLLRVTAPRVQATIVEPVVLAALNYATRVATVAADAVRSAAGRPVYDFSLRRLDGPEAGPATARAAWLAGFAGTALPLAGLLHGIPTVGTMAHHAVMARGEDHEEDAFADALGDHPEGTAVLVDTYDTTRGIERAMAASRRTGSPLRGVRIDSGDLAQGARDARAQLDAAGFGDTRIMLSGDLDAESIGAMVRDGVPADDFGLGTRLRAGDPLGGVYKLCAQHDETDPSRRSVMKRSPGKETDPGVHGLARRGTGDDTELEIHLSHEATPGEPLLHPVVRCGVEVPGALDLGAARERAAAELGRAGTVPAPVRRSRALRELRSSLSGELLLGPDDALVVVDVQHDFLPGGALGVPDGDRVLAPIGRLLDRAREAGATIVASRDRHPVGHVSFAERGGTWPPHCVDGTRGAELHPDLDLRGATTLDKGTDVDRDAYSAFDGTRLLERLRAAGVRRAVVCGLATDYCVRATVLDALHGGLPTVVVTDAVAAVDVQPGDGGRALEELRAAGASVATTAAARAH
ncbi:nicotinate phosphoribosyltransferase [Patulibacter sp.]|uniref:nicotinate phosphoribosyltransferase n=1 Tax=Patulibacter sp. TaxID=1912859 RepID=UPI0027178D46|nr:nicotinate phosphoribosyltransferase [Patulibacter sp.]MDO9407611.1 nicotinate phosphoribosyltransferase [Patulibacter sp.]